MTFNRLHDVYQNSTVYLTFPCNRTKRFEHSLGTMKLCNDIFISALNNSESKLRGQFLNFYSVKLKNILEEIKLQKYKEYGNLLGGRVRKIQTDDLPPVEQKFFLYHSDEVNQYYTTYFILTQAIRISALLHDIGHPPYSHITEFALEKVRNSCEKFTKTKRIEDFNNIMNSFFGEDGKKLHEKILTNEPPFKSLHRIVDGTLDGDRLDYVTCDALNSGLDRGKIEYDRLCNTMVLAKYEDEYWICPDIKALNTIEDYLDRRWNVYKNIIYHHRVIKQIIYSKVLYKRYQ